MKRCCCLMLVWWIGVHGAQARRADDSAPAAATPEATKKLLQRRIIEPTLTMSEVQEYAERRIKPVPMFQDLAEWKGYATEVRARVLKDVILRGRARQWAEAKTRVQWLTTIAGGPGYHIKKLRYEALPGLWIPALLYEPDRLAGKVPAVLNVNGHDGKGKVARYKQIRCINQAKRGMLALNVEWLGMGQLRSPGFAHHKLNQIDLCGTSGIAVQYLYLKRALDLLLSLEHTDPARVAVTGLSGGGWQTIFISSLDTRVSLADPVAGYSSFLTRARHLSDLGDSEQTPTDLATVADYSVLTALMAPRPTLLTYNAKDNCCFRADHALQPLLAAAKPIFKLYGHPERLRWHVNKDPGTHNYELDNRQALYRMLGDFFFAGAEFDPKEIPSDKEVKSKKELDVELPADNLDFHKLAVRLSGELPRDGQLPCDPSAARQWQRRRRDTLRALLRPPQTSAAATKVAEQQQGDLQVTYWKLRVADTWTVPVVELAGAQRKATAIVLADGGRTAAAGPAARLLADGYRVLAVDPFYFGEAKVQQRDYLFALLIATVGGRPLGIQAAQVAAVAGWQCDRTAAAPTVVADGPRSCLIALAAAAIEPKAIAGLRLKGSFGSLKQIIEQDRGVNQAPELFCFGLLERFDIRQLIALIAPRPVKLIDPSQRAKDELKGLGTWYALWGSSFDPLSGQ